MKRPVRIGIKKVPNNITVEVEFYLTQEFRLRQFIATQLMKLAAKVLGCKVKFRSTNETRS